MTGWAGMLHILAGFHAEGDQTARPAHEDSQDATDQPSEHPVFVVRCSHDGFVAVRTHHLSRNISRQLLHHNHLVHRLYNLRLLWAVLVSPHRVDGWMDGWMDGGMDNGLRLVIQRWARVRRCWHCHRRWLTLLHDIGL